MVRITAFAVLAFAASTFALTPDPAGAKNLGNGAGGQFIGGACNNNADCQSACCAAQSDGTQPVCSGPGAQFQAGKLGCGSAEGKASAPPQAPPQAPPAGVVNPAAPANPPASGGAGGITPDPAGAKNQGNGAGGQFIGGACDSNADCQSACCAAQSNGAQSVCSGPGAQFQAGKLGCGSGNKARRAVPVQW